MNSPFGGHTYVCHERQQMGYPCNCLVSVLKPAEDDVNHPSHYTQHPSKVECIAIVEHMTFNLGNAVKYIWRAGLKSPETAKDLRKAIWYLNREILRLEHVEEDNPEEQRAASSPADH